MDVGATITATDLLAMSGAALDELFSTGTADALPTGRGRGQALTMTGGALAGPVAALTRLSAWKGKEFADDGSSLRNLLGPVGMRAITAAVRIDDSWIDGRPCVVLDYSATSTFARWVRDEIREIAPGLYLGVVFLRSRRAPVHFSLEFDHRQP